MEKLHCQILLAIISSLIGGISRICKIATFSMDGFLSQILTEGLMNSLDFEIREYALGL